MFSRALSLTGVHSREVLLALLEAEQQWRREGGLAGEKGAWKASALCFKGTRASDSGAQNFNFFSKGEVLSTGQMWQQGVNLRWAK